MCNFVIIPFYGQPTLSLPQIPLLCALLVPFLISAVIAAFLKVHQYIFSCKIQLLFIFLELKTDDSKNTATQKKIFEFLETLNL